MTQVPQFTFPGSPWPGATALPAIALMIQALLDGNAGPTPPTNPVPFMIWVDTSAAPPVIRQRNAANAAWVLYRDQVLAGPGNLALSATGGDVITLSTGGAERMRIDANGNVGIGTSTPAYRLDVRNGILAAGNGSIVGGISYSNRPEMGSISNHDLGFITNNETKMVLTTSGTLGLGVVPSAWASGAAALQMPNGVAYTQYGFSQNAYLNAGYKYMTSDFASLYQQTGGQHLFYIAPFGTTGAPISFTPAMTLDASGTLLLGTTGWAPGQSAIQINSSGRVDISAYSTAARSLLVFANPNGYVGSIGVSGNATSFFTSSDYRLKEDVRPIADAVARFAALKPVDFAWKADGTRTDGFIAHEVQAVVPQAVTGERDAVDADGSPVYQGIDQSKLVPLLTAALQEALAAIVSLTARVEALEQ